MRLLLIFTFFTIAACSAGAQRETPEQLISESMRSTVQVFVEREQGGVGAGSGIVVFSDNNETLVATAAHVVGEQGGQISLRGNQPNSPAQVAAQVAFLDVERDLALLKAPPMGAREITLQDQVRLGDRVWVASYPWGRQATLVSGSVSQIRAEANEAGVIKLEGAAALIDAPVNYGSSGGGIFAAATGQVVGIVRGYKTAKVAVSDSQTISVPISGETTVIPSNDIMSALEQLRQAAAESQNASRPSLSQRASEKYYF